MKKLKYYSISLNHNDITIYGCMIVAYDRWDALNKFVNDTVGINEIVEKATELTITELK